MTAPVARTLCRPPRWRRCRVSSFLPLAVVALSSARTVASLASPTSPVATSAGPHQAILLPTYLLPTCPARLSAAAGSSPHARQQTRRMSSARPTFLYSVAASFVAKGLQYDPSAYFLDFDPVTRAAQPPRPRQQQHDASRKLSRERAKAARPASGQDAFFISHLGDSAGGVAVGVADGVGGWVDSGIDPADFSHAFCGYMATAASGHARHPSAGADTPQQQQHRHSSRARQVMQRGYEDVCEDPDVFAGGSTAVVGLFDDDGTLEVANLGDSGFMHLRPGAVHAHSPAQTHAFNTPYQLSVVPQSMLLRAAAFGGAQLMDLPRDADVTRHALRHGDVVVFGSDGLWDNLFDQDVLRIVNRTMSLAGAWDTTDAGVNVASHLAPLTMPESAAAAVADETETATGSAKKATTLQSLLATGIVGAAKSASLNSRLQGPFAKEVKKYYPNESWLGGKEDDICVVVAVVSEKQGEGEEASTATTKAKL